MPPTVFPGEDNFARYRQENLYYVDKTGFLEDFLSLNHMVTLFTRPRRFGKTLTLSMMAEFFDITKDSSALFEGLAISRNKELCGKWMNQYPVIFLSLKDMGAESFEEACGRLEKLIAEQIRERHPELLTSRKVDPYTRKDLKDLAKSRAHFVNVEMCLGMLCFALHAHYGKSAIILIDDYDFPARKAQEHGFYDEMLSLLIGFLSVGLKSNDYLEFGVLAGCLYLREKGILAGRLNNLSCFDMSVERHDDAFGFTEAEVAAMLETYGMADRMGEVREWYDGYRIGETEHIYNPWGITKYVEDHLRKPDMAPRTYSLGISHCGITKALLAETDCDVEAGLEKLLDGGCVYAALEDPTNYDWLFERPWHIWPWLFMAGYLTRESVEPRMNLSVIPWEKELPLVFPSRDVRQVFAKELREWFRDRFLMPDCRNVHMQFWDGKAQELERALEKHMAKTLRDSDHARYMYHMLLLFLFAENFEVSSRRESGSRRYDIAVRDEENGRAAVIEVVTGYRDLASLAGQALRGIAEKKLDADLRAEGRYTTILHWGIAFYERACKAEVKEVKIRDSRGE